MASVLNASIFALHISSGAIAMVSGIVALCAKKGSRLHHAAGVAFAVAMLVDKIRCSVSSKSTAKFNSRSNTTHSKFAYFVASARYVPFRTTHHFRGGN
jgi:uncharacterized membrane protein